MKQIHKLSKLLVAVDPFCEKSQITRVIPSVSETLDGGRFPANLET